MYGLKSDPRSVFFFLKNSRYGAERISVLAKTHGLFRSGFSALTMTRIRTERIIRTNSLSRIRTDLPEIVTERIGSDRISARGKCHGLSRSGYPPSKKSRIFAERIFVKRIFHGVDYLTPSNKPHTPWDLSTVNRSNSQLNINDYPRIVDGYPRTSTMKGDNNETMMINNTSSSSSTTDRWKKHDTRTRTAVWQIGNSARIFHISIFQPT